MNILAFFTKYGEPATGLNPTIRIREIPSGTLVVTDSLMTEVGDGFYNYDFISYNSEKDYSIRSDGGVTLPEGERYVYAGNENYNDDIDKVITNNTSIQSISGSINDLSTTTNNVPSAVWYYTLNGMPSGSAGEILVSRGYNGQVVIDTDIGSAGQSYPYGTHYKPVNNLNDAIEIAEKYSLWTIHTHSDLTINRNVRNYTVEGVNTPTIRLNTSADCKNTLFEKVQIEGDLQGELIYIDKTLVDDINNFAGNMINSSIRGDISLTGFRPVVFLNNTTAATNISTAPKININNSSMIMREHKGPLRIEGKTSNTSSYIEIWSGCVEIMSTCVSGTIVVCGQGNIIDNSGPNCIVDSGRLLKPSEVSEIYNNTLNIPLDVWSENTSGYSTSGSYGYIVNQMDNSIASNQDYLKRIVGLVHENIYIDNPTFDSDGNMTSARLRIYSNPVDVGTSNGVIGTYNISAPGNGPGKFTSWSQIRVS